MIVDSSRKRFTLPKRLGIAILVSVSLVGIQFQLQKQLQPSFLLYSSSALDNRRSISSYATEATSLLFGSTISTNNIGSGSKSTKKSTILVSNVFTQAANQNNNKKMTKQRNIFFIHVGKTGGTTLRETVIRYGCRLYGSEVAKENCLQFLKQHGGESVLGEHTTGIFHYQQRYPNTKDQINKMDWLFTVRDPIARFVSSFEYINPHNCILDAMKEQNMEQKCNRQFQAQNFPGSFPSKFFYDCFSNVQDFLQFQPPPSVKKKKKKKKKRKQKKKKGKETVDTSLQHVVNAEVDEQKKKCYQLWKGAFVAGTFEDYGHMTANYQYYTNGLKLLKSQPPGGDDGTTSHKVYVIRMEHMWEDVSTIDSLVGGSGNFSHVQGTVANQQTIVTRNATLNADKTKSEQFKLVPLSFCCALLPDMLAFRNIVNRADNLNGEQKHETNALVWTRCNVTSWEGLQSKCGMPKKNKKKRLK